jgi:hypothetical protein
MTWRLIALCDTESAAAPSVKLEFWPTASKARSAFSGSQRRLILLRLAMIETLSECTIPPLLARNAADLT